jgi:hypothetical protein
MANRPSNPKNKGQHFAAFFFEPVGALRLAHKWIDGVVLGLTDTDIIDRGIVDYAHGEGL